MAAAGPGADSEALGPVTPHARPHVKPRDESDSEVKAAQSDSRSRNRNSRAGGRVGGARKRAPAVDQVDGHLVDSPSVVMGPSRAAQARHEQRAAVAAAAAAAAAAARTDCAGPGVHERAAAGGPRSTATAKYSSMRSWSWSDLLDYAVRLNRRAHSSGPIIKGLVGLALLPKVSLCGR
jgi:hypothetical protein